jgi:hypothetical protein
MLITRLNRLECLANCSQDENSDGLQPVSDGVSAFMAHRPVSSKEAEDIMTKFVGKNLFNRLSEQSRKELIEHERLFRQYYYREDEQLEQWGGIALPPFKVIETEMTSRLKYYDEKGKPPTLGNIIGEFKQFSNGKQSTLGELVDKIFPSLIDEKKHINKLFSLIQGYRNPAAHPSDYPSEKIKKLREKLFDEGLLRNILELVVI